MRTLEARARRPRRHPRDHAAEDAPLDAEQGICAEVRDVEAPAHGAPRVGGRHTKFDTQIRMADSRFGGTERLAAAAPAAQAACLRARRVRWRSAHPAARARGAPRWPTSARRPAAPAAALGPAQHGDWRSGGRNVAHRLRRAMPTPQPATCIVLVEGSAPRSTTFATLDEARAACGERGARRRVRPQARLQPVGVCVRARRRGVRAVRHRAGGRVSLRAARLAGADRLDRAQPGSAAAPPMDLASPGARLRGSCRARR